MTGLLTLFTSIIPVVIGREKVQKYRSLIKALRKSLHYDENQKVKISFVLEITKDEPGIIDGSRYLVPRSDEQRLLHILSLQRFERTTCHKYYSIIKNTSRESGFLYVSSRQLIHQFKFVELFINT